MQHWFYATMSLAAQNRLLSQLPELCADKARHWVFLRSPMRRHISIVEQVRDC